MPIAFSCPTCAKGFRVNDDMAGRKSKCPACSTPLTVPHNDAITTHPAPPDDPWAATAPESNGYDDGGAVVSTPRPARARGPRDFKKMAVLGGIGLAVCAVVALGGGLIWYFASGSGLASDDLKYLPEGCQAVASFRPADYLDSTVAKEVKKALEVKDEKDLDKQLEESFGVPGKDISQIVYGGVVSSADTIDGFTPIGGPIGAQPPKSNKERVLIVHTKRKDLDAKDMLSKKKRALPWALFGRDSLGQGNILEVAQFLSPEFYNTFTGDKDIAPSGMGEAKTGEEKVGDLTVHTKGDECFCIVPDSKLVICCDRLETLKKILERGKKAELSDGMRAAIKQADLGKTYAAAYNVKGIKEEQENAVKKRRAKENEKKEKQYSSPNVERERDEPIECLALGIDFGSDIKVSGTVLFKDRSTASSAAKFFESIIAMQRLEKKGYKEPEKARDDSTDYTAAKKKLFEAKRDGFQVEQDIMDSVDVSSTFSKLSCNVKIKGDAAVKSIKSKKAEKDAQKEVQDAFQKMGGTGGPMFPIRE